MSLIIKIERDDWRFRIEFYRTNITSQNFLHAEEANSLTQTTNIVIEEVRAWIREG